MDKLKKKYLFLLILVIVGIIMGIIFSNILSVDDEKLVYTKLTLFFNNLKNDVPINYGENLLTNLKNNFLYLLIIWFFGVSIIGLIFNNFIIFFKSFILGFSIGSIINIYLYKGIVLALIYLFPSGILSLLILIIMAYYANDFSLKLFNVLFRKKEYQLSLIMKRYSKILGVFMIVMFLNSLFETFIQPFLIKIFSFLF